MSDLRERLANPEAFLTRTDLAELGFSRSGIDALVRAAAEDGSGVLRLPGFGRPMIRVSDYHSVIARHSYGEDRVHPISRPRRR